MMIDDNKFQEVVKEEGETMLFQADGTSGKDGTIDGVGATKFNDGGDEVDSYSYQNDEGATAEEAQSTRMEMSTSMHPPDDYAVICIMHPPQLWRR
jgi:hypothetical protein